MFAVDSGTGAFLWLFLAFAGSLLLINALIDVGGSQIRERIRELTRTHRSTASHR